jgi:hypothetical protein
MQVLKNMYSRKPYFFKICSEIMLSNSDLKHGSHTSACLFTKYAKYLFCYCEIIYYALLVTTCDLYANQLEIRSR